MLTLSSWSGKCGFSEHNKIDLTSADNKSLLQTSSALKLLTSIWRACWDPKKKSKTQSCTLLLADKLCTTWVTFLLNK